MRKTLLGLGLVTVLAFGAGLGAIGTLAVTDDDDTVTTMHGTAMPMGGMAGMPMAGMPMGAMAMNGMAGMAGMPMDAEDMEAMHASMPADAESMDAMHKAMSAAMPADARARCDEAHAAMTASRTG